jgi:anion-transporting  ArsA/GET3 family ATPase
MSNVHIVLQGKGGVGKSLAASMLAQYLVKRGDNPCALIRTRSMPPLPGLRLSMLPKSSCWKTGT